MQLEGACLHSYFQGDTGRLLKELVSTKRSDKFDMETNYLMAPVYTPDFFLDECMAVLSRLE